MRRPTLLVLLIALALALAVAAGPAAADTLPSNTAAPALSGAKTLGATLTASTGTWSGTTPIAYSYRWFRCPSGQTTTPGCSAITGSWTTSSTYATTGADVHRRIAVEVRATNGAGSVTTMAPPYGDVVTPCGMYCTTIDATSGLKDYWRLDDPYEAGCAAPAWDRKRDQMSGTTCHSSAGAQVSGATPDDANSGAAFDNAAGTGSFGIWATPDAALGGTSAWTIEFWVQPHADYGVGPIVEAGDALTVSSYNYWGASGLTLARNGTNNTSYLCANRDQWAHVAITYDGATVKAYCNGTVVNSIASAASVTAPSSIRFFSSNAAYDELAVYDRALSATEVAGHIDARDRHAGPPVNQTAPSISGTKTVGSTLTASPGTWDGTLPISYEYRWFRCPSGQTTMPGCTAITGSWTTSSTYTTTGADVYHRIAVDVRATNSLGFASAGAPPYGDIGTVCGTYCTTIAATSGLKDYWRLDDPYEAGCAAPAFDLKRNLVSGSVCHGPASGQVAGATSDGTSYAMAFDNASGPGSFGIWATPDLALGGTNPWTFELWIQPHADYGVGPIIEATNVLSLTSYNYWGTNGLGVQRASTFSNGYLCAARDAWAHLAVTYDGTTVKAYCNGLLANSVAESSSVTATTPIRFFSSNAAYDELAIYDRALSQTEVQTHYAAR